jgi:peptidoglycan/xylan/chitin deacetylase (PgdA/CDA1 family)
MSAYQKSNSATSRMFRAGGDLIATSARGKNRLCIVTYHRIVESHDPLLASETDIATFRWQMKLLADGFNVLPLHEAIQALHQRRLPSRAVCITFDDGYRSVHNLALPVLQEFNLPAAVFTTTAYMDGGSMWNDRIVEAVRHLPDGLLDLHAVGLGIYVLGGMRQRQDIVRKLDEETKYLLPQLRLDVITTLEQLAGKTAASDLMLSRAMIASLSDNGIEIGGHTVTHPILTSLDDDLARHEIVENKQMLEVIAGKPLRYFAYPNGKAGFDFDQRHIEMVRQAGYSAAFTTATGAATRHDDVYQIPRSRPWDATPVRFGLRLLRWLANFGI